MAKFVKPVGKAPQQRQKYDPRERFSDVSYPDGAVVDAAKRGLASINSEGRYAGNEDNYFPESRMNSPWLEEMPVESWLKGNAASKLVPKPMTMAEPNFSRSEVDPAMQISIDRLNEMLGRSPSSVDQTGFAPMTPKDSNWVDEMKTGSIMKRPFPRSKPKVQSNGLIRESAGMYRDPKNAKRGVFRA